MIENQSIFFHVLQNLIKSNVLLVQIPLYRKAAIEVCYDKVRRQQKMKRTVSFYDTKPYDRVFFEKKKDHYGIEINFHETKLNAKAELDIPLPSL